ncbi:hypothetical protein JKF63_05035 [Porcisia hertigi]|uniref:UmuC domain-containing protein n=1 Tax=Porcisia hertigi TaxID=2761500 RepID=A0A836LEV6_9TRYP|nr:hypothetical protein JKF63_05035 [Porcisia hertigi]
MAFHSTSSSFSIDVMRCIAHIDMDCFYAQVEALRLGVDCRVTPFALSQWGSLIAVNYPARARGVKRFHLSPDEVRRELPDVQMSHIATYAMGESKYGYPEAPRINTHMVSLEPYRHASRQIFAILRAEPGVKVGKAGIDEAYMDVTEAARWELAEVRAAAAGALLDPLADVMEPTTRLIEDRRAEMEAWLGARGASLAAVFDEPMRALLRGECGAELEGSRGFCIGVDDATYAERCLLLCAASRVVYRLRQRIYSELHYDCSAGIAHNRVLAKCISARHKPNQQTLVLPDRSASALFDLPLSGLRGFGGKFGAAVSAVCGGVTECREAWLVPLAQLRKLDGVCRVGDDGDAEGGGGDVHVNGISAVSSKDSGVGIGGVGEDSQDTPCGNGVYTFFRVRGFGGDTVAEPAWPRGIKASKVFHPACSSWSAAQLWMAPLAGELWHRFLECKSRYYKEGRSLVVLFRTYVAPEQARCGQHARSYRRQAPLPANVQEATEITDIGLREFVKLMREVTTKGGWGGEASQRKPAVTTSPPQLLDLHAHMEPKGRNTPAGAAASAGDVLPMPPLHMIELSIIGLRVRSVPQGEASHHSTAEITDGEASAAVQRSLADMFAALSANARATGQPRYLHSSESAGELGRKRSRSGLREGEATRGPGQRVVVEIDGGDKEKSVGDDFLDFDVDLCEAAKGRKGDQLSQQGQLMRPASASPPPLRRTRKDFIHKPTTVSDVFAAEKARASTRKGRQVAVISVDDEDVMVRMPHESCVSITNVSSEDEEM